MRRVDSFGRGVVFAAAAALTWVPWAFLWVPVVGAWSARSLYLVAVTVAYVGLLAERPRSRVVAAAALLCTAALVPVHTMAELAMTLAVIVGVFRSGLVYGTSGARSLVIELLLLGGGLVFARFLGASWLLSTTAGVWGFFLVQSVYFLRGDLRSPRGVEAGGDGFEAAYQRATDLLDQP